MVDQKGQYAYKFLITNISYTWEVILFHITLLRKNPIKMVPMNQTSILITLQIMVTVNQSQREELLLRLDRHTNNCLIANISCMWEVTVSLITQNKGMLIKIP